MTTPEPPSFPAVYKEYVPPPPPPPKSSVPATPSARLNVPDTAPFPPPPNPPFPGVSELPPAKQLPPPPPP